MTRFAMAWTVLVVALAGCTGRTVHPAITPTGAPPAGSASPKAPPSSPSATVLPAIELAGDLEEPPAEWQQVAFIPFGDRRKQLGLHRFRESPDSVPSSFAIDMDGSIWIADRWKDRLAHFSAKGTFLEAVGLSPERRITDMAIVGGRPYVIVSEQQGLVDRVDPFGTTTRITIHQAGRPLVTYELYGTRRGLVAYVAGFADSGGASEPAGPVGFVDVDADSGSVRELPGIPTGPGRFARAVGQDSGTEDSQVTYVAEGLTTVQPLRIRLRVSRGGRLLPAVAGFANVLFTGEDLVAFVRVSPYRSIDARRYGDGRWLLRIGRSALVWERLPEPAIADELQHRHVAVGPNGSIYLMLLREDGELILRRP